MKIVFMVLAALVLACFSCVSSEWAERQDFTSTSICPVTKPNFFLSHGLAKLSSPWKEYTLVSGKIAIFFFFFFFFDYQIGHFGNIS